MIHVGLYQGECTASECKEEGHTRTASQCQINDDSQSQARHSTGSTLGRARSLSPAHLPPHRAKRTQAARALSLESAEGSCRQLRAESAESELKVV